MDRLSKSMRVYKRSAIYLGGCIGFALVVGLATQWGGRRFLFGLDSILLYYSFRSGRRILGSENCSR